MQLVIFQIDQNGNFKVRKLKERQGGQQGAVAMSYKQWSIVQWSIVCYMVTVHAIVKNCLA